MVDRREQAEPTPSSVRRNPRGAPPPVVAVRNMKKRAGSMESDIVEVSLWPGVEGAQGSIPGRWWGRFGGQVRYGRANAWESRR